MRGMDASTGKPLDGLDHLRQSIADILRTPIGSRVMNREYGSRLFELIDAPMNAGTIAAMHAATADALTKWEPRFRVVRSVVTRAAGRLNITLEGTLQGAAVTINDIVI